METQLRNKPLGYSSLESRKDTGAHYTPANLSAFVASEIVNQLDTTDLTRYKILDPAVGDGELIIALLRELKITRRENEVKVYGFDTDNNALGSAANRIRTEFPNIPCVFRNEDFLEFAICHGREDLFNPKAENYDIVIANPPYVRTQVLGAKEARKIANSFKLSGRVDLYHAFLLGIEMVLEPGGLAGVITSNRFMTTKSGASVRSAILSGFNILHIWDLGDTQLFEAAVLPCVLVVKKKNRNEKYHSPNFTSIYSTTKHPDYEAPDAIEALKFVGTVRIASNHVFEVRSGFLDHDQHDDGVWRISTTISDNLLFKVKLNSYCTFGDIGKIRVGIKTTADKVFIRSDWTSLPSDEQPEILYPLITHHIANRYRSIESPNPLYILYPHTVVNGKRGTVDLNSFPKMTNYLTKRRDILEAREYVVNSGRKWFEIWVPQNPMAWLKPKLVFRDISEQPTFWIDLSGGIVNGDCYWLICDKAGKDELLWLALAIGNSTFIEWFYDHTFNNKLYSGRRRFMTQYVEKFPIPHPDSEIGQEIIRLAKKAYEKVFSREIESISKEIDQLIWKAFGLSIKEISG